MSVITEHIQTFYDPTIPRKLHIIWIGTPIPNYLTENMLRWGELMPDWDIYLWKHENITEEHFPTDIIERINMCEKYAQRADIMRCFIIEKYGGFYVDADITPHRSLEPLRFMRSDVILCHDNAVTWDFIMNSFFGVTQNHPLMKTACELCRTTSINVGNISHYTGPGLLGVAVAKTPPPDGRKYLLLSTEYFYLNKWNNNRFGEHLYAHTWK